MDAVFAHVFKRKRCTLHELQRTFGASVCTDDLTVGSDGHLRAIRCRDGSLLGYVDGIPVFFACRERTCNELVERYIVGEKTVGMDSEWRPVRRRGQRERTALLQIASTRGCILCRVKHMTSLPRHLQDVLQDPSVAKVGVGIRNDVASLLRSHGTLINGARNLDTERGQSLQSLAQNVCGFEKWKRKDVTLSDWARPCLSRTQLWYAATDAVASLRVGLALNVSNVQQ